MNYQRINTITGWVVFAISLLTYWLTMEETASYWDCGEFIAVSYKLEVSHPPGAPLFMLMGRMFSFLALGDVTQVGYWINFMSILASAFTILFLFWSITLVGRKMITLKNDQDLENHTWVLMGAGIVGALAYTFSDSFWFSAVEAEVYAMSSFFTAFVVWAMLKWDLISDESKANRWIILIAYMMGLSIGVHLLNLVAMPALALVFYFKKYKPTLWGIIATLGISGALVLFISELIIPGLPTLAGHFEIFFVNTLGMFFGSGVLVFVLLLIAGVVYAIYYTHTKNHPIWNTFVLSTAFILIGYASYAIIVIRSNYDPPINENAPKDVMSFIRYLKREQYGSRPLLTGNYFTSESPIDIKLSDPIYTKGKSKYEITDRKYELVYAPEHKTILPRAWNPDHKATYQRLMGLEEGEIPSFAQNLGFMFRHQIGHMYVRYFMFNFSGRESDEQGAYELNLLSSNKNLPETLANNKGRNNFYMIPFLLGLAGMFFQLVKDSKSFAIVGLLFVMLGVAIVIYLNSPPTEPRERDYIYAGSYYAFCFWIGLAVIGFAELLNGMFKNMKTSAIAATLIGLTAPAIMAQQGWDDHNRSDRFFSVDSAKNYLNSCAPNAILFTGGDNDTFPLWYAQEVEGVRTDVRVVVLSYFNTDWYIDQMTRKAYESEPFPFTLSLKNYQQGGPNDYLPFTDYKLKAIDAKEYIGLLAKDFQQLRNGDRNVVPSKILSLSVDTAGVRAKGVVPASMDSLIVDQMAFRLVRGGLEKKDLAILDILTTNNWERPIYFNPTSLDQVNFDLGPYAIQEGNAYRILPVRNTNQSREYLVNTDVAYENMIQKFSYRGLDNEKLYFNEDYRGFVLNHRASFNALVQALIDEKKLEKANEAMQFSLKKMPDKVVYYDQTAPTTVDLLFQLGQKEQALEMAQTVGRRADEMLTYLIDQNAGFSNELRSNMYILNALQTILYENGETELAQKWEEAYNKHIESLQINGALPRRDL
jgi:Protein of unknown function (DUF2723)